LVRETYIMARKKKQTTESVRSRRPARTLDGSFRRNNVVISRSQKEVAARQRSVTQRQVEKKHIRQKRQQRHKVMLAACVIIVGLFLYQSTIRSVAIASNASTKLSDEQQVSYELSLRQIYRSHTVAGQSWSSDSNAVKQDFLDMYPEVEWVSLKTHTPFSSTLKADIRFRSPVFTWKDASGVRQYVDQNGVLFSKNMDSNINTESLIQIEDKSGVVLKAGSPVLTNNLIAFVGQLHTVVPQIFGNDVKISNVIIPKSTREVQLKVSGKPYVIKFNSFRDIEGQVGELKGLLKYLDSQKIVPQQYIDLRVEHKAFYK